MKTFKSIIKEDLKEAGKQHLISKIDSIRARDYNTVLTLSLKDTITKEERTELFEFTRRYEDTVYNGMEDIHEHIGNPYKVRRQVSYVQLCLYNCEVS